MIINGLHTSRAAVSQREKSIASPSTSTAMLCWSSTCQKTSNNNKIVWQMNDSAVELYYVRVAAFFPHDYSYKNQVCYSPVGTYSSVGPQVVCCQHKVIFLRTNEFFFVALILRGNELNAWA